MDLHFPEFPNGKTQGIAGRGTRGESGFMNDLEKFSVSLADPLQSHLE